jgi:hypothetical protein
MAGNWDEFVMKLCQIFNGFDGPSCDCLWWRTDDPYAPVTFFINCHDALWWATADCDELTPAALPLLEQAVTDLKALHPQGDYSEAPLLFCCRKRQMRPQRPCYEYIPAVRHPLFDACGPPREE